MLKIKKLYKLTVNKKNIIFLIFFLLLGFFFGNIFGLNSKILINSFCDFLFLFFPLVIEILNFINNKTKEKNMSKTFFLIFTSLRRGFLLGIFIEAFKLGS